MAAHANQRSGEPPQDIDHSFIDFFSGLVYSVLDL
jgi:hypothetical protein